MFTPSQIAAQPVWWGLVLSSGRRVDVEQGLLDAEQDHMLFFLSGMWAQILEGSLLSLGSGGGGIPGPGSWMLKEGEKTTVALKL